MKTSWRSRIARLNPKWDISHNITCSLALGIILFLPSLLCSQDYYAPSERFRFAKGTYLSGEYGTSFRECTLLLESFPELTFRDSVQSLAAQNLIQLGDLPGIETWLIPLEDSPHNDLYAFSGIALGYNKLRLAEYEAAREVAISRALFSDHTPHLHPYATLETAASFLLERDFVSFDSVRSNGNFEQYEVNRAIGKLESARTEYQGTNRKSPFLAGTLSTVIPGGGQAYGKRWGNAASYLFFSSVIAVQSWEGYNKGGFRDPQFIVFSTAFLGVYLSNIYGSIVHTKRYNAKIETDFRNRVLVEVALPVESLFDRR